MTEVNDNRPGLEAMREVAHEEADKAISEAQVALVQAGMFLWAKQATDAELSRCIAEGMADGMKSVTDRLMSSPVFRSTWIDAVRGVEFEIKDLFAVVQESNGEQG